MGDPKRLSRAYDEIDELFEDGENDFKHYLYLDKIKFRNFNDVICLDDVGIWFMMDFDKDGRFSRQDLCSFAQWCDMVITWKEKKFLTNRRKGMKMSGDYSIQEEIKFQAYREIWNYCTDQETLMTYTAKKVKKEENSNQKKKGGGLKSIVSFFGFDNSDEKEPSSLEIDPQAIEESQKTERVQRELPNEVIIQAEEESEYILDLKKHHTSKHSSKRRNLSSHDNNFQKSDDSIHYSSSSIDDESTFNGNQRKNIFSFVTECFGKSQKPKKSFRKKRRTREKEELEYYKRREQKKKEAKEKRKANPKSTKVSKGKKKNSKKGKKEKNNESQKQHKRFSLKLFYSWFESLFFRYEVNGEYFYSIESLHTIFRVFRIEKTGITLKYFVDYLQLLAEHLGLQGLEFEQLDDKIHSYIVKIFVKKFIHNYFAQYSKLFELKNQ